MKEKPSPPPANAGRELLLPPARILGIESSCDETAAAVVENGRKVISSLVASQVDLHAQFGGVFPEVASRQHIKAIYPIVEGALQQAHMSLQDIDAIAVTRGPGLPGSLVVGMNAAKGLALGSGRPLIGVNHLEAHVYSAWIDVGKEHLVGKKQLPGKEHLSGDNEVNLPPEPQFPLLTLIVSGGHTELVLMHGHLRYERLGATLDDAAGEAFDKVARLIGLGYPGGPAIQKAAEKGNPKTFSFPRAWLEDTWNFSFSGLKTAVLREVRRIQALSGPVENTDKPSDQRLPASLIADLAASFQAAVVDVLLGKTLQAARAFKVSEIIVAGGVSANQPLRRAFLAQKEFPVHIPHISLCTDNAAMIAAAGYFRYSIGKEHLTGQRDWLAMDVMPNWPLSEL